MGFKCVVTSRDTASHGVGHYRKRLHTLPSDLRDEQHQLPRVFCMHLLPNTR